MVPPEGKAGSLAKTQAPPSGASNLSRSKVLWAEAAPSRLERDCSESLPWPVWAPKLPAEGAAPLMLTVLLDKL